MTGATPTVITRFAPSPTGFLHIGGARTALYNWLYARRHQGKFLLRIEDTDKERSTKEAVDAIYDGMAWLGLTQDGDAISQASRADRHQQVALELLENGMAYRCFASQEELAEARAEAREQGRPFLGDLWRDKDPADAPSGAPYVVRLKMPRSGETTLKDQVQGDVTVSNNTLDDMVLLRSDGSPTYMLAVVVDDHDMGVTHVIRGDDHLTNSFRQVKLYEAAGWQTPVFAHIALIHGDDGKKLSKRHGALAVDAYRDMGYLAEAMRNYLLRLGWSHGDDEIITDENAVQWFDLEHISKGAARFDYAKLDSLNNHYMRTMTPAALADSLSPYLEAKLGRPATDTEKDRLVNVLPELAERAKRLTDLADSAALYCDIRPVAFTDKALNTVSGDGAEALKVAQAGLLEAPEWSAAPLKDCLFKSAEKAELKVGKLMQPVRAALTGGGQAGDLAEMLSILGRDEALSRIEDALGQAD